MKTKTKSFSISDQTLEKIKEIKKTLGMTSDSVIIQLAINFLYEKEVAAKRNHLKL